MSQKMPVAVQIYTLRSLGSLDAMLDAAVEAGYQAVELLGPHVEDFAATKEKLDARGLVAAAAHIKLAALRAKPDWILAGAKALGLHHVFLSSYPVDEEPKAWDARGRELANLARWLRSQGVRLGYHNHAVEFVPLEDGTLPFDLMLAHSGDSLFVELYLAWIARAGQDPGAMIGKYADRLLAVHVKDLAPEGENADEDGWADAGHGVLQLDRWCRESLAAGAKWLIVEHDKPRDPLASITRSRAFLSKLAVPA